VTPPTADVATLTAVYAGVDPEHLHEALESVRAQTTPPAEVLVVADGPLTDPLETVIADFADHLPLTVLRLPVRSGAGPARQAGLRAASAAWVAVVDADDVSLPERLERQVEAAERADLSLLGTAVEEFDTDTAQVLGTRAFATSHEQLARQLRTRNAFNHPSVLMRRERALAVGGYQDLPYLEDYDLCARIGASGGRMGNLDEVLVRFRGGAPSQRRRREPGWFAAEVRLQRNLRSYGLIRAWQVVGNLVVRSGYRLMPPGADRLAYRLVFLSRLPRRRASTRAGARSA
jgi:glycosyltransferase involved in cell wall biosynthesis